MKSANLNIFEGKNSVLDFLNPDKNPMIPIVEIPQELNPFSKDGVKIYAKLMNMLPLGNVKSLPALHMLASAKEKNTLKDVHSLIENSSGNTVFSLAILGRLFGIPRTEAIVSHEVTWGKLQLLRLLGTEIRVNEEPICPDPNDTTSGIYLAKQIGKNKHWFNPGQYDNEANPQAHEKWTGPQLWKQLGADISVFCAGLGTTGTILGTSRYLKHQSKKIVTIGVARKANNPVPGVRTPNLLQQIAFDWNTYVDHVAECGTKESFESSLRLCRCGLLVGPSSGFALAGLINFLREQKEAKNLDRLRNENGEIVAVFICPDGPLPYLNEYFEYLDSSYFPNIENEHLLINKPEITKKSISLPRKINEIQAEEAYNILYPVSKKELWNLANQQKKIPLNQNILLIDVRTNHEFQHFHLPGSKNIELQNLAKKLPALIKEARGKKVLFVCKTGNRSGMATHMAQTKKINAMNLIGGVTRWSELNFPRIRPATCQAKFKV